MFIFVHGWRDVWHFMTDIKMAERSCYHFDWCKILWRIVHLPRTPRLKICQRIKTQSKTKTKNSALTSYIPYLIGYVFINSCWNLNSACRKICTPDSKLQPYLTYGITYALYCMYVMGKTRYAYVYGKNAIRLHFVELKLATCILLQQQ